MFWVFIATLALLGFFFNVSQQIRAGISTRPETTEILPEKPAAVRYLRSLLSGTPLSIAFLAIALLSAAFTSYINPNGGQIAVFDRIYLCSPIRDGRVVALAGECGRQARHAMPGFQVIPFVNVLNKVTYVNMLNVPDGGYATLVARDGIPLEPGQIAAKPWPLVAADGNTGSLDVDLRMLDATYFLAEGKGRKGLQATVLKPGVYPVNPYLFDYATTSSDGTPNLVVEVKSGFVGVIKSALDEDAVPPFMSTAGSPTGCGAGAAKEKDLGQIKAELVPVGCRGVWDHPLPPGKYFVNENIYEVVQVDTRIQNWTYKGGFTRRSINLTISEKGGIEQEARSIEIPVTDDSVGDVIRVIVEGWTVFVELRVQVRAQPDLAPLVVAAVGDLKAIEERIVTPQIRSIMRNVGGSRIRVKNRAAYEIAKSERESLKARRDLLADPASDRGGLSPEQIAESLRQLDAEIAAISLPDPDEEVERPTEVLDFQNERATLEQIVSEQVRAVGRDAGIEIVSVKIGNVDIPPELLVARQVEQLSGQLRRAYTQQQTAQVQRQALEAARSLADKQDQIVQANVNIQVSEKLKTSRRNEGEAEKSYDIEISQGRKALAEVLGQDRVFMMQLAEKFLETVSEKPEILGNIHLPSTVAINNGSGFDVNGLGAILSGTKLFGGPQTSSEPKDSTGQASQ
ncbi:MAG: SPFH domain-containing protein [Nitratireductor sp.]